MTIVEIGCGVGNAVLPLVEQHSELVRRYNLKNRSDDNNNNSNDDSSSNNNGGIKCDGGGSAATAHPLPGLCTRGRTPPSGGSALRPAAEEGRATAHVNDLSSTHQPLLSSTPQPLRGGRGTVACRRAVESPKRWRIRPTWPCCCFASRRWGRIRVRPSSGRRGTSSTCSSPGGRSFHAITDGSTKVRESFSSRVLEARQCNVL